MTFDSSANQLEVLFFASTHAVAFSELIYATCGVYYFLRARIERMRGRGDIKGVVGIGIPVCPLLCLISFKRGAYQEVLIHASVMK